MTIAKLALRNFLGAGVKAWLRVIVLSLAFVVIIGLQGLYEGVGQQVADAMISTEIGGGQYWHPKYDPQNLMELADAHGPIPSELESLIVESNDPEGPLGAKEAGEGPLHPSIPAIANAIYDAVGIRLDVLPFTPGKVLAALRAKDAQKETREDAAQ